MKFEFLPAFQGDCFLIHAGTDDEPVLIIVDGGPAGTYQQHLRPRLMEIRDGRDLNGGPLTIDLVIVSHVDDDHINGIVDLFDEMFQDAKEGNPPMFEVRALWHNSFDEIVGNKEVTAEVAQFGAASVVPFVEQAADQADRDAALILQSVFQGHQLRQLAMSDELQIPINDGFDRLIMTSAGQAGRRKVGEVTFTIIGPRRSELAALEKAHDKWLKAQEKAGKTVTPGSLLQAMTDNGVPNLSSIVLLADDGERTVLLTGDARGDFILKGLEEIEIVDAGGEFPVDLLKMPHHGSDRNVDEGFLARIPAKQYLLSGNGEYGNPERATLEMLVDARRNAEMELYLTYDLAEIDAERQRVHARERQKDIDKGKPPRPAWSDAEHSLAALVASFPPTTSVIEPTGPVIEL